MNKVCFKAPTMQSKLPYWEGLATEDLAKVFSHTTNSYKLYWFYAILNHLKNGGSGKVSFEQLISDMVVLSWHTVSEYKISLGKLDKLDRLILKSLDLKTEHDEFKNIQEIKKYFQSVGYQNKEVKTWVKQLYRNVPYFFLTPFFQRQVKGMESKAKAKKIEKLAGDIFDTPQAAPYKFKEHNIIIHPVWKSYFIKNIVVLESFIFWNLVQYLQSRNPNVPNISQKILPPNPKRGSLSKARETWSILLKKQVYHCIYSNEQIAANDKFSIDHFIPWSFVAHDMFWNLIPIPQAVNSSKSNKLPNLNTYSFDFSKVQYHAYHELLRLKKTALLEDYILFFKENTATISMMPQSDFCNGLHNRISPLIEIAANSGFEKDWVYAL